MYVDPNEQKIVNGITVNVTNTKKNDVLLILKKQDVDLSHTQTHTHTQKKGKQKSK